MSKMALLEPHNFAFNCLPCGFWELICLSVHKGSQRGRL